MIAFDTLAYCKKLQAAGMPAEQAETFTRALQDAIRPVDAEELAIHGDLLVLRKYLDEEMAKQKLSLIKWLIGMFIAQSGLLIGVIALCHQQP